MLASAGAREEGEDAAAMVLRSDRNCTSATLVREQDVATGWPVPLQVRDSWIRIRPGICDAEDTLVVDNLNIDDRGLVVDALCGYLMENRERRCRKAGAMRGVAAVTEAAALAATEVGGARPAISRREAMR
jgi:hypothetical protein